MIFDGNEYRPDPDPAKRNDKSVIRGRTYSFVAGCILMNSDRETIGG